MIYKTQDLQNVSLTFIFFSNFKEWGDFGPAVYVITKITLIRGFHEIFQEFVDFMHKTQEL